MRFDGISVIAEDSQGRKAVLILRNVDADWVAMDVRDIEAMGTFEPTRVFEVDIWSERSRLRSRVEQIQAYIMGGLKKRSEAAE